MRSNSKTELFPIYKDRNENKYIVDVIEDGRYIGTRLSNGFRYLGDLSEIIDTGDKVSLSPISKFIVKYFWIPKMIIFSLVMLFRNH